MTAPQFLHQLQRRRIALGAKWIAWELEDAGYSTLIRAWDFRPGMNFVSIMQKGVGECRCRLIVLSPNFPGSGFVEAEWTSAFAKDPTGENGILVPIRVRRMRTVRIVPCTYLFIYVTDERDERYVLLGRTSISTLAPFALQPLMLTCRLVFCQLRTDAATRLKMC